MIAILLLAATLGGASAPDPGEARVMAKLVPAFRGVIISTYPDGRTGRLHLNRDHTYRYVGRTGVRSGGTWGLNGDDSKICLKQRQPHFIPIGYCTAIPSGRSWSAKAVDGQMVRLHVVSGRG